MALTQISTRGIKDGTITGSDLATNVDLVDNQKIRLGTGNDLQIYHDGSNSYLVNTTGELNIRDESRIKLRTDQFVLNNHANNESIIYAAANGAVELFHNGSKKFETQSDGVTIHSDNDSTTGVKGDFRFMQAGTTNTIITFDASASTLKFEDNRKAVFGAGDDLAIYHSGSHSFIKDSGTGNFVINTSGFRLNNAADGENMITADENGAVSLFHDDSKKLETTSTGVDVSGQLKISVGGTLKMFSLSSGNGFNFQDNVKAEFGNSGDLKIYHDGSHSYIQDSGTGDLTLIASKTVIGSSNNAEVCASFTENGAVELYHDNSKKLETHTNGVVIPSGANKCLRIFGTNNVHSTSGLIISQNNSTDSQLRAYGSDASTNGRIQFNSSRSDGTNSFNIVYDSGNLEFPDNQKAIFGTGSDLQIFHDGTENFLNANSNVIIKTQDGDNMAKFPKNAAVELYHDNSKKFETTSSGVSVTGALTASGNVTAFSDVTLKQDINTISDALNKVLNLRGVSYSRKDTKQKGIGVVAQEIEQILPEVVENGEYKSVAYGNIVALLIEAIKDLNTQIKELKK